MILLAKASKYDIWVWSWNREVAVKLMIRVACSFMLRGSIHRQVGNWQRLMWWGGDTARLLTGKIIANKATPLWMTDRLQGRPCLPAVLLHGASLCLDINMMSRHTCTKAHAEDFSIQSDISPTTQITEGQLIMSLCTRAQSIVYIQGSQYAFITHFKLNSILIWWQYKRKSIILTTWKKKHSILIKQHFTSN